jgi:hypothetical protein
MEPKKVGRTLGIGVRIASNMVKERMQQASTASPVIIPPQNRRASAKDQVQNAKKGAKAFGQALLGPFTHAGSILWLEITGLFFALFALFFVQSAYRVYSSWRQGPEHQHFWLYVVLAAGFGWFSVSSFGRAYRKGKRGPKKA